jgi:hypothetical protein
LLINIKQECYAGHVASKAIQSLSWPICSITSLASLHSECSQFVLKGMISSMLSRNRDETVVRIHCSCHGQVVEDMDGHLKCEQCQTKGMVEMTGNNDTLKVGILGVLLWSFIFISFCDTMEFNCLIVLFVHSCSNLMGSGVGSTIFA